MKNLPKTLTNIASQHGCELIRKPQYFNGIYVGVSYYIVFNGALQVAVKKDTSRGTGWIVYSYYSWRDSCPLWYCKNMWEVARVLSDFHRNEYTGYRM